MSTMLAGAAYILLVCLCVLAPPTRSEGEIEYQNELGCALEVTCPKGYAMNAVYGKAGYEPVPGSNPPVPIATSYDYEWFWNCEEIGHWKVEEEYCYPYYIPNPAALAAFRCPKDFYIAGLSSPALSTHREWTVRCCRQPGLCISDCCLSDYLNDFGEDISHDLSDGLFFVGLFNHLDTPNPLTNQRRWKVGACRFEKCDLKYYLKKYLYHKK